MLAKFIVTKENDSEWRHECQFNDTEFSIGRNSANNLVLEDADKVVSRQHAKLRLEGTAYVLIDLGSRNSTVLNDEKVQADTPYQLTPGDVIKIGDFALEYQLEEPEQPTVAETDISSDATVLFHNPFLEEVEELRGAIQRLQQKYSEQDEVVRKGALQQSIQDMLALADEDEAGKVLAVEFANAYKLEAPPAIKEEPKPAKAKAKPEPVKEKADLADVKGEAQIVVSDKRMANAMDMFINSTLGMVKEAWKFRSEFIGIATIESQGSLYSTTTKQLQEFLFSNSISDSEAKRRLVMIKMQIDELQLHYKALQNGYKASLKEGPQKLLQLLDPISMEKHFGKKANGMLPFYAKVKVYECLKQKINEIRSEGNAGFEQNILRPAFIERYMRTMSGGHRETESQLF